MIIIEAISKTNTNGEIYYEAAEAAPETATSIVFNGIEYIVYEGDEPVVGG
jgi:hypothetical protein